MSKKQEHNAPLSAELMQKYREGKLSAQEMHRIERLLLENPFYAEAMEGLDKMRKDTPLDTHMADLKERLDQRVGSSQKSIPLYRRSWQIAASVVLLSIGAWVGYYYFNNGQNKSAEQMLSMQNETDVSTQQKPTPLRDEEDVQPIQQEPNKTETTENPTLSAIQKNESPVNEIISSADAVEVVEEQTTNPVFADSETLPPLASQQPEIEAKEEINEQPTLAISKTPEENADQANRSTRLLKSADAGANVKGEGHTDYTLRGRVLSAEDKSALPGVNVIVKNTSLSTVTDANGDFKLPIPDDQNEVIFNSIGFTTANQTITQSDSSIIVVLDPDITALKEVVVVGYGTQEKKTLGASAGTEAQPIVGYSSYKDYLKKSLQYPQAAAANNIEGMVKVSFEVNPNGALQKFSVEKPLGYGCDEEAIRLIKEGPVWQAATEEGEAIIQNVTVKVRFSLKD